MIRIGAGIIAVLVVLLGLAFWQIDREKDRRVKATIRAESAEAQVKAEQDARRHEQEIARNASNQFQKTVTSLQDELSRRPLKPVIIRVPNSTVSQACSTAGATGRPDAEAEGREPTEDEIDIAPELGRYAMDCASNAAQLEALQGWVLSR